MGFWSAFGSVLGGASGSGTLGSWDGGWSTYSSGQSRTKYAANKAYEMQQKAALEMPSLTREGLERAGINPLLATSAFGSLDAGSPSFAEASSGGSSFSLDGLKGLLSKDKKKIAENEVEKGEETNELIKEQKEKVKEETRGQKLENDLKPLKTAVSVATGVGALSGTAYAISKAYKALKSSPIDKAAGSLVKSDILQASKMGLNLSKTFRSINPLALLLPDVFSAFSSSVIDDVKNSADKKEMVRRYDTLMNSLH